MKGMKQKAREIKYSYLVKKKTEGGCKSEYVEEARKWATSNPEEIESLAVEAFLVAAASEWQSPLTSKTPNIVQSDLMIAGKPVPTEIRFKDADVIGGYRTVLCRYATFRQWQRSLLAKQEEYVKLGESINEEWSVYFAGLERVGQNNEAFIFDADDGMEKVT